MLTQTLPVADHAARVLTAGRGLVDPSAPRGVVHYELLRGGRVIVPRTRAKNGISNLAKNTLLDCWFNGAGAVASAWAIALVDAPTYTSFAATDTMAAHGGWFEFSAYTTLGSGTNRGAWGQGAAAGQAVTNPTPAVYDFAGISGTATVYGVFVTSGVSKGGASGLLWSSAAFLAPLVVQNGDQLRVTYTVQL